MINEEFYLNDKAEYSMSGKTLRYILNQIPINSKIPFADIKYEGGALSIEIIAEISKRKKVLPNNYKDGKFIINDELLKS